ncbi:hypothetical protein J4226_01930 [Candidatus Pacearchaeota archaeon]|nr:hypothetical protein [Candidatus Pacearchaeota archaeon]
MKKTFVFLLAVALVLPLATAFNCTKLNGEEYKFCEYIEDQDWPQKEKDILIQDAIDSNEASLNGNFESTLGKEVPCILQLNKPEERAVISEDNKKFLIDFSSISLFVYILYSFLKKYYLLLNLL